MGLFESEAFVLLVKAVIIGISVAAPVGPIGMLCIQRTLNNGFKAGLFTGLGAATADGIYGLIAGLGVSAFYAALHAWQLGINVLGGLILLGFGISLLRKSYVDNKGGEDIKMLPGYAYTTSLFLTLANPATILAFVAIFSGVGIDHIGSSYDNALMFVAGITAGAVLWWLFLSGLVAYVVHEHLKAKFLRRINLFSGAVFLTFGVLAISRLFIL